MVANPLKLGEAFAMTDSGWSLARDRTRLKQRLARAVKSNPSSWASANQNFPCSESSKAYRSLKEAKLFIMTCESPTQTRSLSGQSQQQTHHSNQRVSSFEMKPGQIKSWTPHILAAPSSSNELLCLHVVAGSNCLAERKTRKIDHLLLFHLSQ